MKFLRFQLFALAAVIAAVGLCSVNLQAESGTPPAKRLKTGLFVDDGSHSNGALLWARMLDNSPEIELTLLDGEDLRSGKLTGLDLLVMPGGSSQAQYEAMREEGAEAIRRFVASGGAYVGTCAGLHIALNRDSRVKLISFGLRKPHWHGGMAPLAVDFTESGAKRLGITPGRYVVIYSSGPIIVPTEQPGKGWSEVICTYAGTVTPRGREIAGFSGTPAAVYGEYGKGKVAATGFHPEYKASTRCIAFGCIYATTGVKPRMVCPPKKSRPIRAGYFSNAILGKRCFSTALELERCPDIDLRFVGVADLDAGDLEHLDVIIFADGKESVYARLISPQRKGEILAFMQRGGRVFLSGNAAKYIPEHQNSVVLPKGASFVPEVLRAVK